MHRFEVGDRVRIDIPDESDADHERFHGEHGTIVSILEDDTGEVTGEEQDSRLLRIEFDSGQTMDFRRHDLRPPLE